jgi:diguanylate cyclase (GGDEF)-like protein
MGDQHTGSSSGLEGAAENTPANLAGEELLAVIRQSPEACIVVNAAFMVQFANPTAHALFDGRCEVGNRLTGLDEIAQARIAQAIRAQSSLQAIAHVAGSEMTVEITGVPLDTGQVLYIRDISDLVRLRQELAAQAQMLTSLQETLEARGEEIASLRAAIDRREGDPLSSATGPLALEKRLNQEYQRSHRYRSALSLMLVEVERPGGGVPTKQDADADPIMQQAAAILTQVARTTDFVVRYSSQAFALVLPETRGQDALVVASRVRSAMARHSWDGIQVTLSIGVASATVSTRDGSELRSQAERALRASRRLGGDRATHYAEFRDPLSDASSVLD